jgi:hypothetical protein
MEFTLSIALISAQMALRNLSSVSALISSEPCLRCSVQFIDDTSVKWKTAVDLSTSAEVNRYKKWCCIKSFIRKNVCGTFQKAVATCWICSFYCTSSAVANLAPTLVTLIFVFWPGLPPFTKITNPCTLAMPSPCLLVSVICTSYSFPVSTGFGPKLPPPKRLPPPPNRLSPYDISQKPFGSLQYK